MWPAKGNDVVINLPRIKDAQGALKTLGETTATLYFLAGHLPRSPTMPPATPAPKATTPTTAKATPTTSGQGDAATTRPSTATIEGQGARQDRTSA